MLSGVCGCLCSAVGLSCERRRPSSWTMYAVSLIMRDMRTFKSYDPDQAYLLPPDLRAWVPEGHLALFIGDVVDALDLSAILLDYERGDGRGQPPYHPVMMVKLLVYGYCTGKTSPTESSLRIRTRITLLPGFRLQTSDPRQNVGPA